MYVDPPERAPFQVLIKTFSTGSIKSPVVRASTAMITKPS